MFENTTKMYRKELITLLVAKESTTICDSVIMHSQYIRKLGAHVMNETNKYLN